MSCTTQASPFASTPFDGILGLGFKDQVAVFHPKRENRYTLDTGRCQDLSMGHSFNILDDMYGLLGPGKLSDRIAIVKVVKNLRTGALPAGLFSVFLTEVGWTWKDSELRGQFFSRLA